MGPGGTSPVKVDGRQMRALWWEGTESDGRLMMVDQRLLPHRVATVAATSAEETARVIRDMAVRGAPSIGAAAAYGMVLGRGDFDAAARFLRASRPTARDLFTAVDWMLASGRPTLARAHTYVEDIVARCAAIGAHGAKTLASHARADGSVRVLTHCHAGAFATVDHGSALAPLHHVSQTVGSPLRPFVWVDETRPRMQGSLTAWELGQAGIPHKVIVDAAAASRFAAGEVDLVLVGADRIAANGDVANKIGTYGVAVLAHHHGVPFYVAAPASTFDLWLANGKAIPIEERGQEEVLSAGGTAAHRPGTLAANPAFDVTPAALVSGYVTEVGVLTREALGSMKDAMRIPFLGAQKTA